MSTNRNELGGNSRNSRQGFHIRVYPCESVVGDFFVRFQLQNRKLAHCRRVLEFPANFWLTCRRRFGNESA
jgi:hypothetical protein